MSTDSRQPLVESQLERLQVSDQSIQYLSLEDVHGHYAAVAAAAAADDDADDDDDDDDDAWWTLIKAKVRCFKGSDEYEVLDVCRTHDETYDIPEYADWVEAAFYGCENQLHIISNNKYMLLKHQPGSNVEPTVLDGPSYVFNRFLSLSHTCFDFHTVHAAFNCGDRDDQVILISKYTCAKIKYNPEAQLCARGDSIIEGPMDTLDMFPCLDKDLFFEIDSGFGIRGTTQAFLFRRDVYARIDYSERKLLESGYIIDLFPCLKRTVFDYYGIQAACYSSRIKDDGFCVVYLFEGKYYAILHFDLDSPSYTAKIPDGVREIYHDWPCLRRFKPWLGATDEQPHLVGAPKVALVEQDYKI